MDEVTDIPNVNIKPNSHSIEQSRSDYGAYSALNNIHNENESQVLTIVLFLLNIWVISLGNF